MTTVRSGQSRTFLLRKGYTMEVSPSGSCIVDRYTDPSSIIEKYNTSAKLKKGPYDTDYGFKVTALSGDTEITIDQYSLDLKKSIFQNYQLVVGMGGQSNMDGRGTLPAILPQGNPNALVYTKNNELMLAVEPSSRTGPNWINNIPEGNSSTNGTKYSCGSDLAKALFNIAGVKNIIVPCAIGSTGMQNWLPPAEDEDMTTLFGAFVNRVRTQQKDNEIPPLICWFGHEANIGQITEDLSTGDIGIEYMEDWNELVQNLRVPFPDSPIIFAQLATHNVLADAQKLRRGGESQRLSESTYGDTTTLVSWTGITDDFSSSNWEAQNTDANNTITVLGDYSFVMQGDGGTVLSNRIRLTEVGKRYKLTLDVTGTGVWKFLASSSQVGGTRSAGSGIEIDFTTDGSGNLVFSRGAAAQATNLTFSITSLEEVVPPLNENTYMIVTHDLPRIADDGYHLSTEAQKQVGLRYAKCYAERVLGMHWINGTGPRLVSVTLPTTSTVLITFNKEIQANANDYGVNLAASLFRVYDDGVEATLTSVARDTNTSAILITLSGATSGVVVVTYGDRAGPNDGSYRAGVVYDNDGMPAPQFGPVIAVAP